MSILSEQDKEQLSMYHEIKELVGKGRITLLKTNETNSDITISVTLSKNGKSITKIRQEVDSGYGYGR